MKKLIAVLLTAALICGLAGCGKDDSVGNEKETSVSEAAKNDTQASVESLKQGDPVSITGQVAGSKLVNGNTLWVQVQQSDGSFIVYHCQLKDEFIDKAEGLKTLTVVSVDGLFLSIFDPEKENTAKLVTLYDCEIK
mgnify:CR=1 FL=1